MADGNAERVLRRMVDAGRPRVDPNAMSPLRAVGMALSKIAEAQMKLALQVNDATEVSLTLSDLPDAVEEGALLLMLDGPSASAGLLAVSPQVLAALIERRTTGRIGAGDVRARRPTRTDAAIASGFFDPVLAAAGDLMAGRPGAESPAGYRFGAAADDMRSVLLKLDDVAFRGLRLRITLTEGGSRTGTVLVVLPAGDAGHAAIGDAPLAQAAHGADAAAPGEEQGTGDDWSARIEAAVMDVPALVRGILGRVTMPLGDVLTLVPGALVPIARDALDAVPLEGADGRVLVRGRLGQSRGYRAIRVRMGDDHTAGQDDDDHPSLPARLPDAITGGARTPQAGPAASPPDRGAGRAGAGSADRLAAAAPLAFDGGAAGFGGHDDPAPLPMAFDMALGPA